MNAQTMIRTAAIATLAGAITAAAAAPLKVEFAGDTGGAEPTAFVPVVGVWRIEAEGNKKVLAVDGRQWKEGQAATGLAEKARALYGERYAEFLDRVQAFAYFPYTVLKDVTDIVNPATGEVYATAPNSTAIDVDLAFQAAGRAFEKWRWTTPSERQRAMLKLADVIEENAAELVAIESENTGKPIGLTLSEEIPPMVDQIRFFAGAARVLEGK